MPKNKISNLFAINYARITYFSFTYRLCFSTHPQKDTTAKTTSHDSKNLLMMKLLRILQVKILINQITNNTSNQDITTKSKTIGESTSDLTEAAQ